MKFYKKVDEILWKKSVKFWESTGESWRKNRGNFGKKIGEVLGVNFVKLWEQFGEKLDEILRTI